jgi:pyruvate,water dikinase
MRRLCLEFGTRLVKAKSLERVEEVWFLTLPEIREALGNPFPRRHLVQSRKASFERTKTVRPPDRFLDQKPILSEVSNSDSILRGVGASPGVVEGIVRIVECPDQMSGFQSGEILVTPSPNPAWTPAYAVAGGLVTATGSILSHGLVSAREYHLPAVIGIADLTKILSTGQRVRVDGNQGTVSVL